VHSIKIASIDEDDLDDNKIARVGATKPALLRAKAAAAVRGKVGVRCRDGSAGMRLDNGIMAAARFALGVEGCMPNDNTRAALESLLGAQGVRRALAALRNDTNDEEEQDDNNEEEQGGNEEEDGFVVTQDDNTKDNETSVGETPKVQRASGRKAHQQTHKEAHHLAYRGGGTLGMSSDSNDGKTRGSKVRPGSRPINEDRKALPPQLREGLRCSEREGKNPAIAAKQTTRTTGPTSGPLAATERQEHPRRPPRETRRQDCKRR
jgi:hypothetical protein